MTSAQEHDVARLEVSGARRTHNALKYVPSFLGVLVLYVIGVSFIADPRSILIHWGAYDLSWVEVLLVVAAMVGMGEQMKVSHPGIDNTMEAIVMAALAGFQILLLVLGAAGVAIFAIFNRTEFLTLTLISMTAAVIALLINARTLRRTIGVGDGSGG
ncbi:MAG: hypothetical protein ABUS57_01020 [Pseudomonadota bacterium]